ncbi:MAG TPA: UbiA family prenyltransferase, partial [Candidatus Nanoarchaeia archaeon]|nr:UbiA family prenyltransferase [Candidatus Nanoarchaeia archaeon]
MWTDIFRMRQWYKNLIIFLPLFFVGLATNGKSFFLVTLGFVALCLMSSANYILNDIADKEKDKVHPEKKYRPLASGKISMWTAGVLAAFCATLSISLASFLSENFFYLLLLFFFLTQLYSFALKNEL